MKLKYRPVRLALSSMIVFSLVAAPSAALAETGVGFEDQGISDSQALLNDSEIAAEPDPEIAEPEVVDTTPQPATGKTSAEKSIAKQKQENLKLIQNRVNTLNAFKKKLAATSNASKIPSLAKDGSNYGTVVNEARKANLIGKAQRTALNTEITNNLNAYKFLAAATKASNDPAQLNTLKNQIRKDYRIYSYFTTKFKALTDAATSLYLLNVVQAWGNQVKANAASNSSATAKAQVAKMDASLNTLAGSKPALGLSTYYLAASTVDSYEQAKPAFKQQAAKVALSGKGSYYGAVSKAQKDIQAANKKLKPPVSVKPLTTKPN